MFMPHVYSAPAASTAAHWNSPAATSRTPASAVTGSGVAAATAPVLPSTPGPYAPHTVTARRAVLLLTPIFTADLLRNEEDALAAGTAVVLDSDIPPLEKIGVARDILVAVDEAQEDVTVPDVTEVVDEEDSAFRELASELQEQLDSAVTNAFSRSFLVAAALGLLALIPILVRRREVSV